MEELLIGHKATGDIWNVINSCEEISLETVRTGSPSKLSFSLIDVNQEDFTFEEGDIVRFNVDDQNIFYGWIFTIKTDRWKNMQVICYDRLRYLKANASYAFYGQTAGSIIRQIAEDLQIDVGDIAETGYQIPSLIESDKPCIDIIQDALTQTLLNTGIIYVLYDNGNGLSLTAASDWVSEYYVGDKSLMTDFSYQTDIDSETYNSIKLVQPNESTGMNDVVIVQDSETIGKWGLLQLYKSVDGDYNVAQMQEQAKQTLDFYNRVRNTFSFEALGINGLRAGMMIRIILPDINVNQIALLESVSHSWTEGVHTMKCDTLELN